MSRNLQCYSSDIGMHTFTPGIDSDMEAEGRSPDPRWCNVCGEARSGLVRLRSSQLWRYIIQEEPW